MPPRLRALTMALVLLAALAVDARGRQLLEVDGIELPRDRAAGCQLSFLGHG